MHLSKDCQLLKAKMRMDDDELIEFEPEKLHNNTIFLNLEVENFPNLNKHVKKSSLELNSLLNHYNKELIK